MLWLSADDLPLFYDQCSNVAYRWDYINRVSIFCQIVACGALSITYGIKALCYKSIGVYRQINC